MKKKLVSLCLLSLLSVLLLAGCGNRNEKNNPNYNSKNYLTGTHYAVIDVQNFGEIYLELYANIAPATVTNFINLANEGFYNGLTFHRVVKDFIIQGGDPYGDGTGTSTYNLPGEFALNGFDNSLSHLRGTISMARAEGYDSASCQFFIVHQDSTGLDGVYAAFGRVISGMDVVDEICIAAIVEDDDGTVLSENQPIINSIYTIDKENAYFEADQNNVEEIELPDPVAIINLFKLEGVTDVPATTSWEIDENGQTYYLSSTEDLLSLAIYEIDLTKGMEYDLENALAYTADFPANAFLSMTITVPEDELTLLLVAEEHNGALGRYLLGYDKNNNTAYLIPVA